MKHSTSMVQRFRARVDKSAHPKGCWLWTGSRNNKGYGQLRIKGQSKSVLAHRFAYSLKYGPIPQRKEVCHTCDNPSCVRPSHLFTGSHRDNLVDAAGKGRMKGGGFRKLSADQVQQIRYSPHPCRLLARQFGVSHQTISLVRLNRVHHDPTFVQLPLIRQGESVLAFLERTR